MHVHTSDSPDSDIPARRLARLGVKHNLYAVGFVAHLDLNPDDFCCGAFNAEVYDRSILSARKETEGEILLMKGLEIGEPHLYEEQIKQTVNYSNYDFITGALHSVTGIGMVLGAGVYGNVDPAGIVEQYYNETLEMVEKADIDILAHMGLFRRGLALAGIKHDFKDELLWPKIIRRILETLIERNIALELNTSGLRRKERTTYPSREILLLYKELGGSLITIGSDTHREQHKFFGLEHGRDLLFESGFRKVYTYINRIPEEFNLNW